MKKEAPRLDLIHEGKDNWEHTSEFRKRMNEIRRDLSDKYALLLSKENNWFKRLLIRFRHVIEMKKRVDELSSWKNLYVSH